jgi:hypothetical protein
MEKWKTECNPGKQIAVTILCIGLGMALAIGFHDYSGPDTANGKAGFLLGILLLLIGVIGLLAQGKQIVIVDPVVRQVIIEDKSLFGSKKRKIRFPDITGISIGYLGKKTNFVNNYYLVLIISRCNQYNEMLKILFIRTGRNFYMI